MSKSGVRTKISGYFKLMRPLNGAIAFISVIMGAFLANGDLASLDKILITASAAFIILSSGNVINDYYDVETDRINKPYRPIPSRQIKRTNALIFSICLFIAGVCMGLFVNLTAFFIALFSSVLLILYTTILRRFLLLGNMTVGLLTGLTFISGGAAVENIGQSLIPAVFAFLFTVAREIVKDIQDVKGDQHAGMSSLPIKLGRRRAMYISFVFFILVILISPVPYLMNLYSIYYLISVTIGVDLVLIICMIIMSKDLNEINTARVSSLMKFDIFIGLGAIYLGGIH
ncbi:digeranylgeranylglyceryl phosphate synthase [Candidatus Poribacteria bacterium]|nr:digeranylgeranylglyceryl phosphate synthase [Candidatus Poribacteria bacterium]